MTSNWNIFNVISAHFFETCQSFSLGSLGGIFNNPEWFYIFLIFALLNCKRVFSLSTCVCYSSLVYKFVMLVNVYFFLIEKRWLMMIRVIILFLMLSCVVSFSAVLILFFTKFPDNWTVHHLSQKITCIVKF